MKRKQRLLIFSLIILALLICSLVFWPFVLNEILAPVALTAWLFLRLFVLSIDQKIYWAGLVLGAVFFLFRHLFQSQAAEETEIPVETPLTFKDIDLWRRILTLYSNEPQEQFFVRRELARVMVSIFASQQGVSASFMVTDALRKGEIPLPETIRAFLFEEEKVQNKRSLKQWIKSIWQAPARWMDERSGRQKAEYYRKIEEVLTFMETSLEMNDGK